MNKAMFSSYALWPKTSVLVLMASGVCRATEEEALVSEEKYHGYSPRTGKSTVPEHKIPHKLFSLRSKNTGDLRWLPFVHIPLQGLTSSWLRFLHSLQLGSHCSSWALMGVSDLPVVRLLTCALVVEGNTIPAFTWPGSQPQVRPPLQFPMEPRIWELCDDERPFTVWISNLFLCLHFSSCFLFLTGRRCGLLLSFFVIQVGFLVWNLLLTLGVDMLRFSHLLHLSELTPSGPACSAVSLTLLPQNICSFNCYLYRYG